MSLNKIERDDLHWLFEHLLLMRNMIEEPTLKGGPPLLVRCESAIKLVAKMLERDRAYRPQDHPNVYPGGALVNPDLEETK